MTVRRMNRLAAIAALPCAAFAAAALYCAVLAAVAMLVPSPGSAAAPPTYTFDQDPIRLGMKALEDARFADAAARFNEAIAAGYQVPRARFGQGEMAALQGRYRVAEKFYSEALKQYALDKPGDDYPEARAALGLMLLKEGRDDDAAAQFQRALTLKPRLWDALYGQARLALKDEKWDEARKLLDAGRNQKGALQGEDKYHYGSALLEMGRGNLSVAETEALLAAALNPADPEYGTLLAAIYEKKGVPALAIEAYERAFAAMTAAAAADSTAAGPAAEPGESTATPTAAAPPAGSKDEDDDDDGGRTIAGPPAAGLTELGRLYQKVGRYNEARGAYLRAIAADSTFAPALHELGGLYRLAGHPDRAAPVYLKALQSDPEDVDALVGLSESTREMHLFEQALDTAARALAIDASRLDVRLAWARAALSSRDTETKAKAAAMFQAFPDSVRLRPDDQVRLAAAQIDMKQFSDAEETLDRVRRAAPRLAEGWFQRGMLDLNTDRTDSAVVHLNEAIRLDPSSAIYRLNLGVALLRADRPRDAIPALREALALNPQLSSGRVLLAQSFILSDSLAQAEQEYRRAVEADASNGPAWRGLGYCLIRKANYREAVSAYKSATAAEPDNADAWAGLGNAYLGLKQWDAAQAAFDRARAIDPANVTLKKGQEILDQARRGGQ